MGRYTGPKHRLARREGVNILDKSSASLKRRLNVPPGGLRGRRMKRRLSEYGTQLREKQKAKIIYGLLEKQFKNLVKLAERKKGDTGETLVSLLETRLDNLVYRLGMARTRAMARQLVGHRHIMVNDKKVNIPSYRVKLNDIISLAPSTQKNQHVLNSLAEKTDTLPFVKKEGISGKLIKIPKKEDVQLPFNLQLIIEYYSR